MSSSSIIPSSQDRVLFLHVSAGVLSKFFRAYSYLPCLTGVVSSLSDSVSFRFSSFSSFLSSSRVLSIPFFFFEFLIDLFLFLFRLGPKISGRDLLLVEECCNAPDPMRQVSASYSP